MQDWILENPPPSLINVFGQSIADKEQFWTQLPDVESSKDSEVVAWMKTMAVEKEIRLWKSSGSEKPERSKVLSIWMKEKPLPDINDCVGADPAVAFLKTGETEEEIKAWILNECKVKHEDVACKALYEWIKISNAWSEKVPRTFREPMVSKLYA